MPTPFAFKIDTNGVPPKSLAYNAPSTVGPMQQACQKSHELTVRPLLELNRYRKMRCGFDCTRGPHPVKMHNKSTKPTILTRVFD